MNLITVDLWNTILVGNREFSENLTKFLASVLFKNERQIRFARSAIKGMMNTRLITQYEYCRLLIKLCSCDMNPLTLMRFMEIKYLDYKPVYLNSKYSLILNDLSKKRNAEIRVLSNVGYLNSSQLSKLINLPVVGSDYLNLLKPDPEFYLRGIYPHIPSSEWLHIGDSNELDMEPVQKLGGTTYKINSSEDWDNILKNPSL